MKAGACILMAIWSLLLIEPLFANLNKKTSYSSCSEKQKLRSSCSTSKCNKPKADENNNNCENNRCSPLMSCPTGNFYLFDHQHFSIAPVIPPKTRAVLINDNRVFKHLTECWHPPRII